MLVDSLERDASALQRPLLARVSGVGHIARRYCDWGVDVTGREGSGEGVIVIATGLMYGSGASRAADSDRIQMLNKWTVRLGKVCQRRRRAD